MRKQYGVRAPNSKANGLWLRNTSPVSRRPFEQRGPVEDDGDRRAVLGRSSIEEESLSVGRDVVLTVGRLFEAGLEERRGRSRPQRLAGRDRNRHNASAGIDVEQLTSVAAPEGLEPS